MNKYIKISAVAVLALGMVGCTKDFDKINTDPDAYSSAPATNMLANSLEAISETWGDDLYRLGDWSGYMVAAYAPETFSYYPSYNEFGNKWYVTYIHFAQLEDVIENNPEAKNTVLCCKLLQQYLMFINTDAFGSCPYSEACKGPAGGTVKPAYDPEIDIYHAIRDSLKSFADQWATGLGEDELGSGDLLYGDFSTSDNPTGNVEMWQRWCNSLRLRLAMRLSNIASEVESSKNTFKEIVGNPDKYPVIEESGQNCYFWWPGTSSYREPWADACESRDYDYNMGKVMVDHLKNQADPRLSVYCKPAADDGEYRGLLHGSTKYYDGDSWQHYSVCSDKFYNSLDGFTPYFRAAETWFLIEEAALKGWISYNAKTAYENGVRCSMEDNEISDKADAYLAGKGAYDGTLAQLYMEEWVALFKQCQEAWSLYRRTGYPHEFFDNVTYKMTKTTCPQYPGEKCVWGCDSKATHTDLPFRFPYPQSEYQYNDENVAKAAEGIVNYTYGKRLCWALENGRK